MPQTVLVFAPHPDDAEFYAGGTLAKFASEGAQVVIVIATDGRCGSFCLDSDTLAKQRAEEARRAASALGAAPPVFLGYADQELDTLPPGKLREQFIRLIRQYRPEVVVAEDAFAPYEPHPDHRAVAWAASDAVTFASLPLVHPEHMAEGLTPHFVIEKYFYLEGTAGVNRCVDISQTLGRKLAALAEHKSQVQFLVEDVMRQAQMAGLEVQTLVGDKAGNPGALLAWAMETQAAEVGLRFNYAYGEAFRYARFHPFIETMLSSQG